MPGKSVTFRLPTTSMLHRPCRVEPRRSSKTGGVATRCTAPRRNLPSRTRSTVPPSLPVVLQRQKLPLRRLSLPCSLRLSMCLKRRKSSRKRPRITSNRRYNRRVCQSTPRAGRCPHDRIQRMTQVPILGMVWRFRTRGFSF